MVGELVVTDGGGSGHHRAHGLRPGVGHPATPTGDYVGSATVTVTASDAGSGVDSVEYQLDDTGLRAVHGAGRGDRGRGPLGAVPRHRQRGQRLRGRLGGLQGRRTGAEEDTTAPTVTAAGLGHARTARATTSARPRSRSPRRTPAPASPESSTRSTAAPSRPTPRRSWSTRSGRTWCTTGPPTSPATSRPSRWSTSPSSRRRRRTPRRRTLAQVAGQQDAAGAYVGSATVTVTATDTGSASPVRVRPRRGRVDGLHRAGHRPQRRRAHGALPGHGRRREHRRPRSRWPSRSWRPGTDACPESDTRATVVIGTENTGITNADTGNGCTINDLIAEHAAYPDHGSVRPARRDGHQPAGHRRPADRPAAGHHRPGSSPFGRRLMRLQLRPGQENTAMPRRTAVKLTTVSAAAVIVAVIAAAPAAQADLVTHCIGTGGAVTVPNDLLVPAGESCALTGTTITGNVRVAAGANLVVTGGHVSGEVQVAADGYLDATSTRHRRHHRAGLGRLRRVPEGRGKRRGDGSGQGLRHDRQLPVHREQHDRRQRGGQRGRGPPGPDDAGRPATSAAPAPTTPTCTTRSSTARSRC